MVWLKNIMIMTLFLLSLNLPFPKESFAEAKAHEVELRQVFEAMGYNVFREGKKIKLTREKDDVVLLEPNSIQAIKNGRTLSLTKPIRHDKASKRHMIHVLDVYKLAKEDNKEKHYRVKKGDTLFKIGKKFNVSVGDLKHWNGLTTDKIEPGQHLHTKEPIYTVQRGDTLWDIAHKTESRVADIKGINDLVSDVVKPGQRLLIPTQPALIPPAKFADGVFPLAQETYDPYGDSYGAKRGFSTVGNTNRTHDGIDIMTSKWVPVFAAIDGTIVNFGWNTYGGYRITIKAKDGTKFYYAHMMGYPPGLKKGQTVSKGQLIAFTGDTGYGVEGTNGKFAPHLHFGMYDAKGSAINPYPYLKWWEMQP